MKVGLDRIRPVVALVSALAITAGLAFAIDYQDPCPCDPGTGGGGGSGFYISCGGFSWWCDGHWNSCQVCDYWSDGVYLGQTSNCPEELTCP